MRGVLAGTPSPAGALVQWKTWQAARRQTGDIRGDVRGQIREFLSTRRARISPEQAGLPVYGGDRRRVSGLRREEVAVLAGISQRVLHPARARQRHRRLRERHRRHRPRAAARRGRAGAPARPDPHRRHDPPAAPPAGPAARPARGAARPRLDDRHARVRAQRPAGHPGRQRPRVARCTHRSTPTRSGRPTTPRFIFLDPHATEFFRDWDKVASDTVALLRAEAGRDPYDRGLSDLIGELSTRSDQFRRPVGRPQRPDPHHRRQAHPPPGRRGPRPAVRVLPDPRRPSQSLLTYTPEPGSPSQDALSLLASWAASPAARRPRDNGQQSPRQDRGIQLAQRIRLTAQRSLRAQLRGSHPDVRGRTRRPGCGPSHFGVQAPDRSMRGKTASRQPAGTSGPGPPAGPGEPPTGVSQVPTRNWPAWE